MGSFMFQFVSHFVNLSFLYLSNRSVLCMVFLLLNEYFSIYRWNPINFNIFSVKSSYIIFNIFLVDLASIYCEIREILIICHFLVLLSLICVQVRSFWLQESERGIIVCICFSWNNWYYLLHSLHCTFISLVIVWNSSIACMSLGSINHKLVLGDSHCQYIINPQYSGKSWAILRFIQYFWGFHP